MNKQDAPIIEKTYTIEFSKESLEKISRGQRMLGSHFSKEKDEIYGAIKPGDTIHLKEENGPVIAKAIAENIRFYPYLDEEKIISMKYTHNHALLDDRYLSRNSLLEDDAFWNKVKTSRYATLFTIKNVEKLSKI
ncbi:hypothetical protein HN903_00210 [archaeon]|nr:hypothetical protein [archaeon]MBT7128160.1 hypothetical protein [archaeon]